MEPGKYYHVYTHANGAENLFRSNDNYIYFLKRYAHFINAIADTFAYCLMPNHLHFLIAVKTEPELEKVWKEKHPDYRDEIRPLTHYEDLVIGQFSHLLNGYTQAYNKLYKRRGSLFVRSFKREEITDDAYLTSVIVYIHSNPVNHGFVKKCDDWLWSSYNSILSEKPTSLKRNEILAWFGNQKEYMAAHNRPGFDPTSTL
jgi:putative transposase